MAPHLGKGKVELTYCLGPPVLVQLGGHPGPDKLNWRKIWAQGWPGEHMPAQLLDAVHCFLAGVDSGIVLLEEERRSWRPWFPSELLPEGKFKAGSEDSEIVLGLHVAEGDGQVSGTIEPGDASPALYPLAVTRDTLEPANVAFVGHVDGAALAAGGSPVWVDPEPLLVGASHQQHDQGQGRRGRQHRHQGVLQAKREQLVRCLLDQVSSIGMKGVFVKVAFLASRPMHFRSVCICFDARKALVNPCSLIQSG